MLLLEASCFTGLNATDLEPQTLALLAQFFSKTSVAGLARVAQAGPTMLGNYADAQQLLSLLPSDDLGPVRTLRAWRNGEALCWDFLVRVLRKVFPRPASVAVAAFIYGTRVAS